MLLWLMLGAVLGLALDRVERRWQAAERSRGRWRGLACALLLAAAFAGIACVYDGALERVELWAFSCLLLYLSLTDIDAYRIPNGCVGLALALRVGYLGLACACGFMSLGQAGGYVLSALAVAALLLLTVLACDRMLGRESLGGGDFKLFAVAALYLGWQQSLLLLPLSCLLGIASSLLWQRVEGEGEPLTRPFPFGPSIALACLASLLWGGPCAAALFGSLS